MMHPEVYKANGIGDVPNLNLTAYMPIPNASDIATGREVIRNDAMTVYTALLLSLPQGTMDHLLAIMLDRNASQLHVLTTPEFSSNAEEDV